MTHRTRILAAAILSAAFAFAQGPGRGRQGGPPDAKTMIERRVSFLASFLTLADDQKARAITIFTDANTASESLRATLRTTNQSISDAVKKNDTAAIDHFAASAGSLDGQLIAIERKADASFYALLRPEQKTKYDSAPRGGFGGPGQGPGGFRRGPRNQ